MFNNNIQMRFLFWVLLLQLSSGSALANPFEPYTNCYQDWWCVEEDPVADNTLEIRLKNQTPFPVTITVEVRGKNLKTPDGKNAPDNISVTLNGYEHLNVLSVIPSQSSNQTWVDIRYHWVAGVLNAKQHPDSTYHRPFALGANYPMVQGFGGSYSHSGASKYAVDFAMPVGTSVHAAREGTVIDIEQQHSRGGASRRYAKYANYIVILHSDGTTGEYYHLRKNGDKVKVGEVVQQGQLIGFSGNTGFSSLPHLHFAVYQAKPFGEYQSLPFEFE